MKLYIWLISLIFLWLVWCSQHAKLIVDGTMLSWKTYIWTQTKNTAQPIHSWWKIPGFFSLTWIKNSIIISWYTVVYKDFFSLDIPKNLTQRSYENAEPAIAQYENLIFSEPTYSQSFYISLQDSSLQKNSFTDKELCLVSTYYNWSPVFSKATTYKKIHNQDFFITRLTFFTEWNKNPYVYITHFCFVDNLVVYDLVLDNYDFSQANQIIDSFDFMK